MNKTRWSLGSFRGWHIWLSIALSLPILIVSLTAIFIAHGKSLGLKEIQVSAGWLPGMEAGKAENAEPRALWVAPDGALWLGTKMGLYRVEGERAARVEDLGLADVKGMQAAGGALWVATTKGLYRVAPADGAAERVARGDFWSLSQQDGTLTAVGKDGRILSSSDAGGHWQAHAAAVDASERIAAAMGRGDQAGGQVPLSKLVMDLHTGKAFFGKAYEWIWIDVIGAAMALLTVTGLVMWWRGQRRKVAALQAQLAALQKMPAAEGSAGLRPATSTS
jgi:hypothetical protein